MNKLLNTFKSIFAFLLDRHKDVRQVSRTDTPDQERQLFSTIMCWALILLIVLVMIIVAGWDVVKQAL